MCKFIKAQLHDYRALALCFTQFPASRKFALLSKWFDVKSSHLASNQCPSKSKVPTLGNSQKIREEKEVRRCRPFTFNFPLWFLLHEERKNHILRSIEDTIASQRGRGGKWWWMDTFFTVPGFKSANFCLGSPTRGQWIIFFCQNMIKEESASWRRSMKGARGINMNPHLYVELVLTH